MSRRILDMRQLKLRILLDMTAWTGKTHGAKTFSVYAGSAHSKFEMNVPSGEGNKIQYIQALSVEELGSVLPSPV